MHRDRAHPPASRPDGDPAAARDTAVRDLADVVAGAAADTGARLAAIARLSCRPIRANQGGASMKRMVLVVALALGVLAGCATDRGVVRNQAGSQAEATCAAGGFAAGSPGYPGCVAALPRGEIYV